MAYPKEVKKRAVQRLLAARDEHGHIPDRAVSKVAAQVGCPERTVRRWVEESDEWNEPDDDNKPTDDDIAEALVASGGNVAQARRVLMHNGFDVAPARTFRRYVAKNNKQLMAYLSEGANGLRNSQLYTRWEAPRRNHTWQGDHAELPVKAIPKGCKHPRKPYLTAFIDDRTRLCTGFGVDFGGRGGAEMIVATLAKAVRVDETTRNGRTVPGGAVGGHPMFLRCDQGADWISNRVGQVLTAFDIQRDATRGHGPWLKGKVERFFGSLQREFCALLPGYTGGGRDEQGRPVPADEDEDLLSADELVARLTAWIDHYNFGRPHGGLSGRSPFEMWHEECHSPLAPVSEEAIRSAMLQVKDTRTVQKDGIQHDNSHYQSPHMPPVGTETTIRHLPLDLRTIEVFVDGAWVCTAKRSQELSDSERQAVYSRRGTETRRIKRQVNRGRLQRNLNVHEMPAADTDNVPVAQPAADNADQTDSRSARPRATTTTGRARAGSALLAMADDAEARPDNSRPHTTEDTDAAATAENTAAGTAGGENEKDQT